MLISEILALCRSRQDSVSFDLGRSENSSTRKSAMHNQRTVSLTVRKRGCERIFLKPAPVAALSLALTVRGRPAFSAAFQALPSQKREIFASAPSAPLYRGSHRSLLPPAYARNADCAPIVVWRKTGDVDRSFDESSVASLPRMLASLAIDEIWICLGL
jgi:hypothetical protein